MLHATAKRWPTMFFYELLRPYATVYNSYYLLNFVVFDLFVTKQTMLESLLRDNMDIEWNSLFHSDKDERAIPIFTSFHAKSDEDDAPTPYQEVQNKQNLTEFVLEKLEEYNLMPTHSAMNLVLFEDAISHVCELHRIITQPRGNCVFVGVGGSGRQSLTKLATHIANLNMFQISVAKGYNKTAFYEDLKKLYIQTGQEEKQTVFLFSDTQLVEKSFLEDINNILSSGEIPNLFPPDELTPILDSLRNSAAKIGAADTDDALYQYFIERARNNMHVVFCMSPIGSMFVDSVRLYPSLVNCTTIKWFAEWPEKALTEVATHFLETSFQDKTKILQGITNSFCEMHTAVAKTAQRMATEIKRHTYVTPTSYLGLVTGYEMLLNEKSKQIQTAADKLINGLHKIDEAKVQVSEMTVDLEKMKNIVAKKQVQCEKLLVQIIQQQREADEKKTKCEIEKAKTAEEAAICQEIEASAQADLDKAIPALEAAQDALNSLSKDAVTEVKSYAKPPPIVATVMSAVMTLLGEDTSWASAKKQLSDANFLLKLKEYDKDNISTNLLKKIKKFVNKPGFTYDEVKSKSTAAAAMCNWVAAMALYADVNREVEPKREKLKKAQQDLYTKEISLKAIMEELAKVEAQVAKLQQQFDESESEKKSLTDKAEELETKLARAGQLVEGLSSEKSRWEISIKEYKISQTNLTGDCALAAAFLSYGGAFDSEYRDSLISEWMKSAHKVNIFLNHKLCCFVQCRKSN